MINKQNRFSIFEIFILIINISMFQTILPSIIFGNLMWYYHQVIIVLINIVYLIWVKLFKKSNKILYYKHQINIAVKSLIIILITIYLFEFPRYLIKGFEGRNIVLTLLNASAFLSFTFVLNTLYMKKIKLGVAPKTALISIIKPYIYFSVFIASTSVIVFFLAKLKFIDLFSFPAPNGLSMYMDNNMATMHTRYFTPLYVTIISAGVRGANYFMNTAIFSGISHEPHIATYLMTPALFMMYGIETISKKRKIIFSVILFIFFLTASSLTNILSLLSIGIIYLFRQFIIKKRVLLTIIIVIVILISLMTLSFETLGLDKMIFKLTNVAGSKDYSLNFIKYVLSPTTILGYGVFNVPYPYAWVNDIGLISSILIMSYYILGYITAVKAIIQRNRILQFVGLATLYFFLHSLKIVQLIFIYPFTIFILFVLVKAFEVNKTPNQ